MIHLMNGEGKINWEQDYDKSEIHRSGSDCHVIKNNKIFVLVNSLTDGFHVFAQLQDHV